jgi:hypothetical protein
MTTDVVVSRDDKGAAGAARFVDLMDLRDAEWGLRIATDRKLPYNSEVLRPEFGNERFVGSNISIAVDPRADKSGTVYAAWADRVGADDYTLHVRRSEDRGATWSEDLKAVTNATNPALAVNSDGVLAFLYQQLTGAGEARRWETHVELTGADSTFAGGHNFALASTPVGPTERGKGTYIGDYVNVMSVGKNFYGVFSANNVPDDSNFPNKVVYQRNADFSKKLLFRDDGVTEVPPSIDPFFFKLTIP